MKQHIIFKSFHSKFLLILLILSTHIAAQDVVSNFGSNSGDTKISGLVSDSDNNIILAGSFTSEELEMAEGQTILNKGITDVFLAKYDPSGVLIWTQSFGGVMEDLVSGICTDDSGNIYITGNFRSNTLFIDGSEVKTSWPDNAYAAKFDGEGNLVWFKHSEKITNYIWAGGITCNPGNKIIITGYTTGNVMSFDEVNLSSESNGYKGYFCRFDSSGSVLSAGFISEESENQFRISDVAADRFGDLYFGGTKFIKLKEPDPITWSDYREALYLKKTAPNGDLIWEHEDTAFYQVQKILCSNDSLFVLGNREEYRIIFNGGTIDTTSRISYSLFDLGGNTLWKKSITGALAYDACEGNSNFFAAGGQLKDKIELSSFTLHRNSDSSSICPIYQDIFYLEISKSGELLNVGNFSGSLEDIPSSIWYTNEGDLLYSGMYESYEMEILGKRIVNTSELSSFQHVSGIYYDRRIFSFYARDEQYGSPNALKPAIADRLQLYPNPSEGTFWLNTGKTAGEHSLRIYDIQGRLQYQERIQSWGAPHPVNLLSLPPGLYMVTLTSKEGKLSKSMVVIE